MDVVTTWQGSENDHRQLFLLATNFAIRHHCLDHVGTAYTDEPVLRNVLVRHVAVDHVEHILQVFSDVHATEDVQHCVNQGVREIADNVSWRYGCSFVRSLHVTHVLSKYLRQPVGTMSTGDGIVHRE